DRDGGEDAEDDDDDEEFDEGETLVLIFFHCSAFLPLLWR
ncbi:MAG: hypothetical protein ACI9DE_001252, partial [Halioglobus sp.]